MEDKNSNQIKQKTAAKSDRLTASGLVWVGLGGIIGAGFFLASGLPISYAGPGVIIAYLLGGLLTAQIVGALTSLTVNHPVEGSFKVYAEELMGPFMGYFVGWTFWISAILTIGSETIAMAIFSKLWFPHAPQWVLVAIYSAIVILLNSFGIENFGKAEMAMSFVKVFALVFFIAIAAAAILGLRHTTQPAGIHTLLQSNGFLPHGITGVFQAMLIVNFAYAGIAVVAMASSDARNPKRDIPRAMFWLVVSLVSLYVVSIFLLLCLTPWNTVSTNNSPFITALQAVHLPVVASGMNFVILIAAFSVMVGAYFSAIIMLVSLANAKQAPAFITHANKHGVYTNSLAVTAVGLVAIIVASYLLPGKIYSYLISASAYFAFLSLGVVLICFLLWRKKVDKSQIYHSKLAFGAPWSTVITLIIIVVMIGYSLTIADQRRGFYFALGISAAICLLYRLTQKNSKNNEPPNR